MNGLLVHTQLEVDKGADTAGEIELVLDRDRELRELARRCRQLLAQPAPEIYPPGHWLG